MSELVEKCKWEWTARNGNNGYLIIGPNEKSIFLPAAGCATQTNTTYLENSIGVYLTSTPSESNNALSYSLEFNYDKINISVYNRDGGQSIRPVIE